jgi:rhamnosyltransferase
MKIALVIPTYNGGELFSKCLESISNQNIQLDQKIIFDSSSTDNTVKKANESGFSVTVIDKNEFDHGGTRSRALQLVNTDIVVFMTQDAILANEYAISELISAFDEDQVDAVFGKQIPHDDANLLATHARENSYSKNDYSITINDEHPKGFRKAFMSNSFAAYRVNKLTELGGFPSKLILGEDSYVAAKILLNNRKVAYRANAAAKHSHNYTVSEEFKRYFDIGVFHQTQSWMIEALGAVEGEGVKFALGQLAFLWKKKAYLQIPKSFLMSAAKFTGYKLGKNHTKFSQKTNIRLSMHNGYFKNIKQ